MNILHKFLTTSLTTTIPNLLITGNTLPALKYPWRTTPIGGSFIMPAKKSRAASIAAAKRLKYGEHWSVRYNREADHSVLTRMEGSRWVRYNWNLLPGQEQSYTFPDRVTAGKAMARCMRQVYRQNMAVSPTTRNWLIAPNYDGLGFTLRRRNV